MYNLVAKEVTVINVYKILKILLFVVENNGARKCKNIVTDLKLYPMVSNINTFTKVNYSRNNTGKRERHAWMQL